VAPDERGFDDRAGADEDVVGYFEGVVREGAVWGRVELVAEVWCGVYKMYEMPRACPPRIAAAAST
jgi:hypothetical protein